MTSENDMASRLIFQPVAPLEKSAHDRRHLLGDGAGASTRINPANAGITGGQAEKAFADPFVETHSLPIQPILLQTVPSSSREPFFNGKVEEEGEVGHETSCDQAVHSLKRPEIKSPAVPLIGQRGMEKPVAEDHGAVPKSWPDYVRQMLAPSRQDQRHLTFGGQVLAGDLKQQLTNVFRKGGPPRLSCFNHSISFAAKEFCQPATLEALAAAFNALEGNKNTSMAWLSPPRTCHDLLLRRFVPT
jgi:hypothetical protein